MSKTDLQLKQDVENELRWDPKINSAQIGVAVDKGAVSLMGSVDTYAQKWAAEDATKRVAGVVGVAEELRARAQTSRSRRGRLRDRQLGGGVILRCRA